MNRALRELQERERALWANEVRRRWLSIYLRLAACIGAAALLHWYGP